MEVDTLRRRLDFDDFDEGSLHTDRGSARLMPPGHCKTFAEVAWAYENHAMGAARRRSALTFVQPSIVPDKLQTVAQKTASLRSPRRSPSPSASARPPSRSGSKDPPLEYNRQHEELAAIQYNEHADAQGSRAGHSIRQRSWGSMSRTGGGSEKYQEVQLETPRRQLKDQDAAYHATPRRSSKLALDFSIYSSKKAANCAKTQVVRSVSGTCAAGKTSREPSQQRRSLGRTRSRSQEQYALCRETFPGARDSMSPRYTGNRASSPPNIASARAAKERLVWERLAAKSDVPVGYKGVQCRWTRALGDLETAALASSPRMATPVLAGLKETASFGYE